MHRAKRIRRKKNQRKRRRLNIVARYARSIFDRNPYPIARQRPLRDNPNLLLCKKLITSPLLKVARYARLGRFTLVSAPLRLAAA
jgi:hypothetical protein